MSGRNIAGSFPNTPPTTAIKSQRHMDTERLSVHTSSSSNTKAVNTPMESEFDSSVTPMAQDKGKAPMRYNLRSSSRQRDDDLESVAALSEGGAAESHHYFEAPGAPIKRKVSDRYRPLSLSSQQAISSSLAEKDDINSKLELMLSQFSTFQQTLQQQQQTLQQQQQEQQQFQQQQLKFNHELEQRQINDHQRPGTQGLRTTASVREFESPAYSVQPTQQVFHHTFQGSDRVAQEIKNFRKEVKTLLPDRPRVILRSDNLNF
jgi:hypothetical protein